MCVAPVPEISSAESFSSKVTELQQHVYHFAIYFGVFDFHDGGGVATPKTEKEMKIDECAELLSKDFVYDFGLNEGWPALEWGNKIYGMHLFADYPQAYFQQLSIIALVYRDYRRNGKSDIGVLPSS